MTNRSLATQEHMLDHLPPTSLKQLADEIAYLIGPERISDLEPIDVSRARLLRWEAFIKEFIYYNNER